MIIKDNEQTLGLNQLDAVDPLGYRTARASPLDDTAVY